MADFIPVNQPLLDGNEKKYLLECIESGWISSEGPFIKKFEEKFRVQKTNSIKEIEHLEAARSVGVLDLHIS
jgi:dTDP-4-amino-4,6-dideoxygalactose transaminase